MSLVEKATLLAGKTHFRTAGVERLGIPAMVPADGHNGINYRQLLWNVATDTIERRGAEPADIVRVVRDLGSLGVEGLTRLLTGEADVSDYAELSEGSREVVPDVVEEARRALPEGGLPSCLPPGVVMGATWDPDLVHECGAAVAKEARAFGVDVLLGPNVNIHRNPLCGRLFESYSEDPCLASRIAVAYIQGVQSQGIAADAKHYVANNQETLRLGVDAQISERALREIYLPAFKAAVQEGQCLTVMSAYNQVNGTSCALNHRLLTQILREEWGFQGFVVSDWGAAYDRVLALKAGNDLEMPGPQDPQVLVEAVRKGELTEEVLDERLTNYLRVLLKLPAFRGKNPEPIQREYSTTIARKLAAEGAVLLKNENVLPLEVGARLAVVGENAQRPIPTGGGSAGVIAPYSVSLLEGLRERYGQQAVDYGAIDTQADAVIIAIGLTSREGADRQSMALPDQDVHMIVQTARKARARGVKSVVVLNVCGPVEMADWVDQVDAVLLIWLGGMELGHAAADLLCGAVNPCGKLPVTFPRRYRDTPSWINFPGEFGKVVYGEGIYVGYRYYDSADVEPLYPFGHGLSYTSFALEGLRLSAECLDLTADDVLEVRVGVHNTGKRAGKQVVQLYIRDLGSTARKPLKELKGFAKVELAPGEKKTVHLTVSVQSLQHYDPRMKRWCVEPGTFEVLVGTSSRAIALRETFEAVGPNPYLLGPQTEIGLLMADGAAVSVLRRCVPSTVMTPERLALQLAASLELPLEVVWDERIAPRLEGFTLEEVETLRQRLYAELARISPG
jgi:beta-glucosidase